MATNEPKMRSITGTLTPLMLTARDDDYSFNVTYTANRTIKDICQLCAKKGSKYSAAELESNYNELLEMAKEELYSGSTVEFGFTNNAVGVDGPLTGTKPKFDPAVNSVTLRSTPRAEIKADLKKINVIVGEIAVNLPTIKGITDITSGQTNSKLTPGGLLNGTGERTKIAGEEGDPIGFFFVNSQTEAETAVPPTSLSRNDPSNFSMLIPQLADGTYYLEVATRYSTGKRGTLVKEVRRTRFPYLLTVGNGGEEERPGEL